MSDAAAAPTRKLKQNNDDNSYHRRRINTEKVVAAVWGTEFIPFLAALAVLHHDDLKIRMNGTRMIRMNSSHSSKSSRCKIATAAR